MCSSEEQRWIRGSYEQERVQLEQTVGGASSKITVMMASDTS